MVLVEGESDRAAVETLAARRGRDLVAERIRVVAMGGATSIRSHVAQYAGVPVAGLCDLAEAPGVRRGLAWAGVDGALFVCDADLEDELIRALGTELMVERVVTRAGELSVFEKFRKQPAQRGRPIHQQLRRFSGTRSGRKIRYAALLVEALDLDRVPEPLDALLTSV